MAEAGGSPRSVGDVYAAAYKAYLKTVQEGLANLDIEAVDIGESTGAGPVLNTVAVPVHTHFTSCIHTHFTNCIHTHFNCIHTHVNTFHTHPTFATTATNATESTLATAPAGGA